MKTIRILLLLVLCITITHLGAQSKDSRKNANNDLIKVAEEIMNSAATCALITLDDEGRPRVRTMSPFKPEKDLTVWFGTNSNSRKVKQIKHDNRVTLYYLENDESGYVMVHGNAELVDDKLEKEKRWKKEWDSFYPENRENYLLIKVIPEWIEVSSAPRGINGDSVTWKPASVIMNSKE